MQATHLQHTHRACSASALAQRTSTPPLRPCCLYTVHNSSHQTLHTCASRRAASRCQAAGPDAPTEGASPASAPQRQLPAINVAETLRGCRTVLAELRGLDFPRNEALLYFKGAKKLPPRFDARGADMARATAALQKLLEVDEDGDALPASSFTDPEGLALAQAVLNDLWRWRRRGGGMDIEENIRAHVIALEELQGVKVAESIDQVSSSLLDNLQLSDQDKRELGVGMQQVAVGAIQGAVWNSIILGALFIVFIAFFARGS